MADSHRGCHGRTGGRRSRVSERAAREEEQSFGQGHKKGSLIRKGDTVKVVSLLGEKSYVRTGTVGDRNPDGSWPVDLSVTHEQEPAAEDRKDRDAEDVSTTVANSTNEESQPANNAGVPLVP